MASNNPKTKSGDRSSGLVSKTLVDGGELCEPESNNINVTLRRAAVPATDDLALWVVIRKSTEAINFKNYSTFIENVLCGIDEKRPRGRKPGVRKRSWPTGCSRDGGSRSMIPMLIAFSRSRPRHF